MTQQPHPSNSRSIWQTLTSKKKIAAWEVGGVLFTNVIGGSLHFAFELSNYATPVALFASVNESTWEHLKFYFWASLLWTLIEFTYVRDEANNYTFAKAMNLLVTPIVVTLLFYGYLAFTLPIYGRGFFAADISTGIVGVLIGHLVSSYLMQREPLGVSWRNRGWAVIAVLTIMFSTFTYFPPKFFLFEDYMGYEYTNQYGILEEYTGPYVIFDRSEAEE